MYASLLQAGTQKKDKEEARKAYDPYKQQGCLIRKVF